MIWAYWVSGILTVMLMIYLVVAVLLLTKQLGWYMAQVYEDKPHGLECPGTACRERGVIL
jgi:hypothetical protein